MRQSLKTKFIRIIRTCSCCVIIMCVTVIFGVNYTYNMTGHWTVPSVVPGTFERVKSVLNVGGELITSRGNAELPKRTLVNVYEGLRKANKTSTSPAVSNRTYSILWYNKPVWINIIRANKMLATQCTYSNCHMTDIPTDIRNYSAIVYCLTSPLGNKPPIAAEERDPDQVWVYFGLEAPIHYKYFSYRHKNWRNTMNWSMTYELDADIYFPYGMLETRDKEVIKDYRSVFSRKTKLAAWFVSNCGAPSKRDAYVAELKRHGAQIDIFGRCADDAFRDRNELTTMLNNTYKFYFSFENSFCKDYITEKFFRYFNLDVVLVVRGGGDYDRVLPNGAFINSAHFSSAEHLAKYLITVGSSVELYSSFLKLKDRYVATEMFELSTSYCAMCHKLNNINENRKSYIDHVTNIHDNTCWSPSDVHLNPMTYLLMSSLLLIILLSLSTFMSVRRSTWYINCSNRCRD